MANTFSRRHDRSTLGSLIGGWLKGRNRGERLPEAARLARRAGLGVVSVDGFESLEQRRLMFTLTIQPGDVPAGSDVGTVEAFFGYVIPYLFQELPDPEDPEVVVEGFEDEDDFWTQFNPPRPPSGTFFNESDIQVAYPAVGADMFLVAGPNQIPDEDDDLDLYVNLTSNGFATFSFFDGVQEGNTTPRLAIATVIDIRQNGAFALNTDATSGTRLELLRDGVVVETLTGGELTAIAAPAFNGNVRFTIDFPAGFDAVRFSSVQVPPDNLTYQDEFIIDQIAPVFPPARFAELINSRIFGSHVVFTGPVGASVQFLDLYDREIVQTIALGNPEGVEIPIVDRNADGVPDFNDGIGRIILRDTNDATNLTMWGGTIEDAQQADPEAEFFQGGFLFKYPGDIAGLLSDFESAGFGYALTNENPPAVIGLPNLQGSLIVGSPWVRDNSSANAYLQNPNPQDLITNPALFRRAGQGIFVEGDNNVGSIIVNSVQHGSSNFGGSVNRLNFGNLYGSLTISGDASSIMVAGDTGYWVRDDVDDAPENVIDPDPIRLTNNEIIVGRSLRQYVVAGRGFTDVTVLGDINSPVRAPLSFLDYAEIERPFNAPNTPPLGDDRDTIRSLMTGNFNFALQNFGVGAAWFRNDNLATPEFIGGPTSTVRVRGDLGRSDVINNNDPSDVFAFAAGSNSQVIVDAVFDIGAGFNEQRGFETLVLARIVDSQGRVLASHQVPTRSEDQLPFLNPSVRFAFTPDHTDVYYLVLNIPTAPPISGTSAYQVALSGMLPVTLGQYRSGASTGLFSDPTAISTASGSIGLVSVGMGYTNAGGAVTDSSDVFNTGDDANDWLSLVGSPGTELEFAL